MKVLITGASGQFARSWPRRSAAITTPRPPHLAHGAPAALADLPLGAGGT